MNFLVLACKQKLTVTEIIFYDLECNNSTFLTPVITNKLTEHIAQYSLKI